MAAPAFNEIHFGVPGNPVEVSGGSVPRPVVFNKENYSAKSALIRSVTFANDVTFEDAHLGIGIKFENCRFLKSIVFKNTKAEGFERSFNADSYSLYFTKCEIRKIVFPVVNEFEHGIYFSKETKIGVVDITDLIVTKGSIRFDGISVSGRLHISNCKLQEKTSQISFVKTIIKPAIRINDNSIEGGVFFINAKFESEVNIVKGEMGELVFKDGEFNDDIKVEKTRIDNGLSLVGSRFNRSFLVNLNGDPEIEAVGSCRKIYITNTSVGRQFDFNSSSELIDDMTLEINKSFEGNYVFNGCRIQDCNIRGDNKNGNIRFSFCEFLRLHFSNFVNSGNIALASSKALEGDSIFETENSSLGKLELFNVLLSSFSNIRLADSFFSEMVTIGVDWFNDKHLEVADNGRVHRNRREVYRQLKQVCDRQGDRIQALEFQAQELIAFRKEMKETRGWFNKDRWILRLSVTNDFGLNWIKPLLWIVLLSVIIFYPLMVASASPNLRLTPATSIDEVKQTFAELQNHRQILPQLFNPARLTFRLFPENYQFGFWIYFWDGLQRIVLAFFIVQIVAAFRKYVRN